MSKILGPSGLPSEPARLAHSRTGDDLAFGAGHEHVLTSAQRMEKNLPERPGQIRHPPPRCYREHMIRSLEFQYFEEYLSSKLEKRKCFLP